MQTFELKGAATYCGQAYGGGGAGGVGVGVGRGVGLDVGSLLRQPLFTYIMKDCPVL